MAGANQIELLLNLTTDKFVSAAKKSLTSYKDAVKYAAKNPIELRESGGADLLKRIVSIGLAVQGLRKTIIAGSNLEEATNKFNVVFKGMEDTANKAAATLVKDFAMSTREARQLMAGMQDLLVPMGMAAQPAADLSFEITKLAADLGSFNNLPTAQVMGDIQSALVGNFETMKKYGVVLNETVVKTEAMNQGLYSGKGLLDASTKAQVAYSLILKGSAASVGDLDRSADSFANTQKKAQARIEDAAASLSRAFMPIAAKAMGGIADLAEGFAGLDEDTQKAVLAIGALTIVMIKLPAVITGIRIAIEGLKSSLKGPAGWLILGVSALATAWTLVSAKTKESVEITDDYLDKIKELDKYELEREILNIEKELAGYRKSLIETGNDLGVVSEKTEKLSDDQKSFDEILKSTKASIDSGVVSVENLTTVNGDAVSSQENLNNKIDTAGNKAWQMANRLNVLKERLNELNKASEESNIAGLTTDQPLNATEAERMIIDTEKAKLVYQQYKADLFSLDTMYNGLNYTAMEEKYASDVMMAEANLNTIAGIYGRENNLYRQAVAERTAMDRNYSRAKMNLGAQAMFATINQGAQLMGAFQGQSETMFGIGKALSIAQATINAYQGASKAIATYPPPLSYAMAAIQVALGLAQVANIAKVNFKSRAEGGEIGRGDVVSSPFTPSGDHGLIGARVGEIVMNQGAAGMYRDELLAMNAAGRKKIPGFATGGTVSEVGNISGVSAQALILAIKEGIKNGFDDSKLKVEGEFRAKAKELVSSINKYNALQGKA